MGDTGDETGTGDETPSGGSEPASRPAPDLVEQLADVAARSGDSAIVHRGLAEVAECVDTETHAEGGVLRAAAINPGCLGAAVSGMFIFLLGAWYLGMPIGHFMQFLLHGGGTSETSVTEVSDTSAGGTGDPGPASAGATHIPPSGRYEIVNASGQMIRDGSPSVLGAQGEAQEILVAFSEDGATARVSGLTGTDAGAGALVPTSLERTSATSTSSTYVGRLLFEAGGGRFDLDITMVFDGEGAVSAAMTGEATVAGTQVHVERTAQGSLVDPGADMSQLVAQDRAPVPTDPATLVATTEQVSPELLGGCEAGAQLLVEDPIAAARPFDALVAFLEGPGPHPPVRSGLVEMRHGDDVAFYAWRESGQLAGVIDLDVLDPGVAVVGWRTLSCH